MPDLLPSQESNALCRQGYLFLQHTQMIYVNFCREADSLVDSGGEGKESIGGIEGDKAKFEKNVLQNRSFLLHL